jgi:hypothetical protein
MEPALMVFNGLVIDVEATGPHPVDFSMIQIGAADLNGATFSAKMRPRADTSYDRGAMKAIGVTWEEAMTWPDPVTQTRLFAEFLADTYGNNRVTTWSDNPAFDWQFVNAYLHMYTGSNPLGFSMRRIGDLYAGHKQDARQANSWKKLRDTKHTHDALDDALGNAEALKKILVMIERKK